MNPILGIDKAMKHEERPNGTTRIEHATMASIKALSPDETNSRQEWLAEVARIHQSAGVRRSAIVALREIGSSLVRPISLLIIAHEEHNQNLRETAIKCLGRVGTEDDLLLLRQLQETEQIARFGKQAAAKASIRLAQRLKRDPTAASSPVAGLQVTEDRLPYFDVALSFAGEDRDVAAALAHGLRAKSLRVFYDMFYKADLISENLAVLLAKIYRQASLYCVVLISKHYPGKSWPQFELSHAQDRAIFGDSAYLIPVRLDSTPLDGIAATVGYIDLRSDSMEEAIDLITQKIQRKRSGSPPLSDLI